MALSADFSRISSSSPSLGKRLMPIDAVMKSSWPSTLNGRASECRILLATPAAASLLPTSLNNSVNSLARPLQVDGHELFITASIGISLFPNDGDDDEILLKSADSAMYRAKELGRNQAQLFTASMNERYVRRLAIEQSLHHALERRELEMHYQPVYDRMRRPVSVEALIRWNHPT